MRIFRLIATPVILLGLLGLLAWGALWGWKALTAPIPSPSPTPCVTQTVETLTGQSVYVRIFNAGFTTGAAGRLRDALESRAFNVIRIDNVEEKIEKVTIRGNTKQNAAALRLLTLQFVPETYVVEDDGRIDGTFDIYLPTDGIEIPETPAAQTGEGVVCVPPPKTPTPEPEPSAESSREP